MIIGNAFDEKITRIIMENEITLEELLDYINTYYGEFIISVDLNREDNDGSTTESVGNSVGETC